VLARHMLKSYALSHPLHMTEVCSWARNGSDDADLALRELIVEFNERGEPPPLGLRAYNNELVHPRLSRHRKRGQKKAKGVLQDFAIVTVVWELAEQFGLKPTRGRASPKASACSIAARALAEANVHRGNEAAIEKIWQRLSPSLLGEGYRGRLVSAT